MQGVIKGGSYMGSWLMSGFCSVHVSVKERALLCDSSCDARRMAFGSDVRKPVVQRHNNIPSEESGVSHISPWAA